MTSSPPGRDVACGAYAGLVAAAAAAGADRWLAPHATGPAWQRHNYQGLPVSLGGGLAAALGLCVGLMAAGRGRCGLPVLVLAAGAGRYDDLVGNRAGQASVKGLRGHAARLLAGQPTAGAGKLAGLAAAAAWSTRTRGDRAGSRRGATVTGAGSMAGDAGDTPVDGLLTAGLVLAAAHVVNLLDLRPGRARKAVALASLAVPPRGGYPLTAITAGVALAGLPADLRERHMLGDAGAAALGAVLGLGLATGGRRARRVAVLTGLGAVALAAERVSLSRVIDQVPPLAWLDQLGRRPPPPPTTTAAVP